MRGIKLEDLDAILDFLYYGEANIYQENLDMFLNIAEELQLKGLDRRVGNTDSPNLLAKPSVQTFSFPEEKNAKLDISDTTSIALVSDLYSFDQPIIQKILLPSQKKNFQGTLMIWTERLTQL